MAHLNSRYAPAGPKALPTSWKSAPIKDAEKNNRFQTFGYHAGFKDSPAWPKDQHELNLHNAEWSRVKAKEYKAKLNVKLGDMEWRIGMGFMWEPVVFLRAHEEGEGSNGSGSGGNSESVSGKKKKGKGKGGKEIGVEVGKCMGIMKQLDGMMVLNFRTWNEEQKLELRERVAWYLLAVRERLAIRPIVNGNVAKGLSKVLGLPSEIWKGNEAELPEQRNPRKLGEKSRAYWPSAAELKADGDDRAKKGLKRRLPLPRLDCFSEEGQKNMWQNYKGKQNEERVCVAEMVKMSGDRIEPKYRMVAPFEGLIDGLESVASAYAEYDKEERASQQKETFREASRRVSKEAAEVEYVADFPPLRQPNEQFFDGTQGHLTQSNTISQHVPYGVQNNDPQYNPYYNSTASGQGNTTQYTFEDIRQEFQPYGQQNIALRFGDNSRVEDSGHRQRREIYTGGHQSGWLSFGSSSQSVYPALSRQGNNYDGTWGLGDVPSTQESDAAWHGYVDNVGNFQEHNIQYGGTDNTNFQDNSAQYGYEDSRNFQENNAQYSYVQDTNWQENEDTRVEYSQTAGDGHTEPGQYANIREPQFGAVEKIPEHEVEEQEMDEGQIMAMCNLNNLGLDD